jgi:hypothetical protein
MGNNFYQLAWDGYAATLITGSTAAANSLLAAAAPQLAFALQLMVITYGILISLGRVDIRTGLIAIARAVTIAAILAPTMYNAWIMQTVLVTLPNWIASALGGGTAGNGITVAGAFDLFRSAINHDAAKLLEAISNGKLIQIIPRSLSVEMANEFAVWMISIAFVVDLATTALVALVAPLGAVLLIGYLFQATRHWTERWIGKLVALLLLEIMIAVLLVILRTQFRANILAMEDANGLGIDIDQAISNLWSTGWDFFMGICLLIALPAMAAAIGGSHVSSVVLAPMRMSTLATNQIATAVARGMSGARAAPAAATPTTNRAP